MSDGGTLTLTRYHIYISMPLSPVFTETGSYIYEPVSVKTGLNGIDIKIEVTTSLESFGFSIPFLQI